MVLRLDSHLVKDKSRSISYTIHKDKSQMNCGFKKPNKYLVARRHGRTVQKKGLSDPDNHDSVVIHLQPNSLECEVKWVSGSITTYKASGGDGIPVELFQILKDEAVKVLHSTCQQIWKTQQWPQDWKMSVFISVPKNVQTTAQLRSFHLLAR